MPSPPPSLTPSSPSTPRCPLDTHIDIVDIGDRDAPVPEQEFGGCPCPVVKGQWGFPQGRAFPLSRSRHDLAVEWQQGVAEARNMWNAILNAPVAAQAVCSQLCCT